MEDGGTGAGGAGGAGGGDAVPPGVQARIDAVVAQRRQVEQQLAAAHTQLAAAQARAEGATALQTQLAQYQAKEAAWADERVIMGAGITDPEGVDFARGAWARIPAETRPAGGLKEWLGKTEALPKGVRAYLPGTGSAPTLPATGTTPPASGAQGSQLGVGLPPSNTGVVPGQAPGGQPKLTAAEIAAMPLAEYEKHRADILSGKR